MIEHIIEHYAGVFQSWRRLCIHGKS